VERKKPERLITTGDKIVMMLSGIIFPAGALWYYLGWFQTLRDWSAGPILMSIGLYGVIRLAKESPKPITLFIILAGLGITGLSAEIIGVQTGLIFGEYAYSNLLGIRIGDVPVSIGMAWVMMGGFAYYLSNRLLSGNRISPFFAALIATLFDVIMEPAAIKLQYWYWNSAQVPIQNYFAWFILTLVFTLTMHHQKVLSPNKSLPVISFLWWIQIVYFILIILV